MRNDKSSIVLFRTTELFKILLLTLDLIKEKLSLAYSRKDEAVMAEDIISIMDICKATANPHFAFSSGIPSGFL